MYLNDAKKHLNILLKQKTPVFLWGAPGIGKSSIVQQLAEEWKVKLIDLRLSLLNPVDLRGLPYLDAKERTAVWLPPEFLPKDGEGILFLDEMNTAPTSVQIAAYQLILDRRLGNYIFPEGWRIIAAGNRETDKASVTKLPAPLANRLIHINVEANIDDWKSWAQNKVDTRVIGFLNFRPELLATLPKAEEKAFPTPRSWNFVSNILSLYETADEAEEAIIGSVGEGASKEFYAFLNIYGELPDVDAILAGKSKEVPQKADVRFALVSALVAKVKVPLIDNFLNYVCLLPAEFSILAVRDVAKAGFRTEIEKSKYWKTWVNKFGQYL